MTLTLFVIPSANAFVTVTEFLQPDFSDPVVEVVEDLLFPGPKTPPPCTEELPNPGDRDVVLPHLQPALRFIAIARVVDRGAL
jgi:hypothetical protein